MECVTLKKITSLSILYCYFRYTVNEALDLILADSDSEEVRSLAILPPLENADADTDVDTDDSDDEVKGAGEHLPRRILASSCIVNNTALEVESQPSSTLHQATGRALPLAAKRSHPEQLSTSNIYDTGHNISTLPANQPASKQSRNVIQIVERSKSKENPRKWKSTMRAVSAFPTNELPPKAPVDLTEYHVMRSEVQTPLDVFHKMLSSELIQTLCFESNIYAAQHGDFFTMNEEDLLTFIGILLLSGYNKVPYRRNYWSNNEDTHNNLVSGAMRRDRFEQIMKYLHIANNMAMSDDRYFKVRPLFNAINKTAKIVPLPKHLSIDETIIPYYGRHGTKQFIRMKPIRFGYKVWTLASTDGTLIHAEPYCGSSTLLEHTMYGQGGDVVLGLLEKANVPEGHTVTVDNLFTSFGLFDALTSKGIGATGTIRENRLAAAPLTDRKTFQKTSRGTTEALTTDNLLLVRWNDNRPVTVLTNYVPLKPSVKCKRWSTKEKKHISLDMPFPLDAYNKQMGGVDLFDQMVSCYRICIRSKKWWWPLFAWTINSVNVNAWRFYQNNNDPTMDLLTFTRQITCQILGTMGTPPRSVGRPRLVGPAGDILRYDGEKHWPIDSTKLGGVCAACKRRTKTRCEKCDVALHVACFKNYHVQ